MNHTILLISILASTMIIGCASPTGNVAQQADVKLGAIIHLTANDYATVGQAFREGIDLAVAEQNANGGIQGRRVVVIYEDSQYDMAKVATAANKLIDVDGVSASLISTYTETSVAGPIFEQRHVPLVNIWDSSKELEDMGDYVFGVGARTESAGSSAAEYAYGTLGIRRAVIVDNSAEWSTAVAGFFRHRFEALGGTIVAEHSSPEGETDFRTVITKIQNSDSDGVFAPLSTHTDLLFRQLRDARYTKPVLASDQVTQQTIDAAGSAADGTYHTVLLLPGGDSTTRFRALYEAHYGKQTDQLLYVGLGYDAAKTLLHAMQTGGTDRTAIKDAMYRTRDLPGAFGAISIDRNGSYSRYESVVQIRNGTDVPVTA